MPMLANIKREAMAQLMCDGIKQTDAHEQAGYARNTSAASRIAADVSFRQRIEELRQERQQQANITREQHIAELQRLQRMAEERKDVKAALQAVKHQGDVAGLYVTKTQDVTPKTPAEVAAELDALEAAAKARGLTH